MSQKFKYCISCGTRHVISLVEVRFCSSCGTPFEASASTGGTQPRTASKVVEENDAEAFDLPQISASDFIIDKPKKLTIEDIKNNPSVGADRGASSSPNLTAEQAKQNFASLFSKERSEGSGE